MSAAERRSSAGLQTYSFDGAEERARQAAQEAARQEAARLRQEQSNLADARAEATMSQ